jgi:glycosyltransferase involved in cell wall biosynthesis
MRILHIVAGEKWTGIAAVVHDWTKALVEAGVETQFAFSAGHNLEKRLLPTGWARPLLTSPHGVAGTLRDFPELSRTLDREPVDVLHVHTSHDHYLAALARRRRAPRPRLVRTIHHIRHTRPDPLMRRLFRSTDAFAFANRDIARALGCERPIHSPVVDTAVFAPGPKPASLPAIGALPAGRLVVGTVGKLSPGRGHEEAIDAAASLPEAVLLHVGKGEHRPALEAKASSAGTPGRNLWAGYQDEGLPEFYRAMDVFLFTASGSQQGQRAVLEAMASGLPVASLDVTGVRDLVTDGVEGFVTASVPELARALAKLSADPPLRARLGEAARQRALSFTASRFAADAAAFYASPRGNRV